MLYFFMNLVDLVEIIAHIDHSLKSAVYDCNHFTPINKGSRQRFFGPAIPSNSLPSMAGVGALHGRGRGEPDWIYDLIWKLHVLNKDVIYVSTLSRHSHPLVIVIPLVIHTVANRRYTCLIR